MNEGQIASIIGMGIIVLVALIVTLWNYNDMKKMGYY